MSRRLSTGVAFWGACLLCYPLASNELGRRRDLEFEELRQAYGPLTYVVHDKPIRKVRGRDTYWVEMRLIGGSHGHPASGERLARERWDEVEIGERWEGAALPGGSPAFQRSVEGEVDVPLFPYVPLGALTLVAAWFQRRRE